MQTKTEEEIMGILWRSCRTSAPMLFNSRGRRFYISTPRILLDKPTLLNCNTRISLPLSDRHSHSNASSFFSRNYVKTSKKTKDLQTKRQVKEVESDDYRINGQITADPIRLVTDTGHQVVSRREALDYAKKLNLDLVEVQFNADPPVCKVMDYNLEKFNQKQREKERAKNKAEGLRKDDCREIRFTAKTEQRDLERKAEMAKQLMDRGCRVKCMAMGTGQQYLEEQLQRFLILIEDVSNVEYGPKIEQRNGYFIARHIKFGVANKKEAQQTIKSVENGMSKTEKDNIKKTSASEKKKEDTAVSPKEEFLDKPAQFEEHAPVEQFEEIVDEFPSIDTAEAISNGICLPTSETKMHSSNTIQQQESVVGDTNCYSETETYLEDSSRNHDSLDQARQALTDTCSIGYRYDSSNIEQQFASDQSLKQCRDPTKVKVPEFLKKGHLSLPLSTNLNVVTEKKDQHGISDGKLSGSASSEVIFGTIHSDQGHFKENVGQVSPADSHFNCAKVSIKDNVKDIPEDYHINASTTSEVIQTIAEELQTTPATLNNDGATQEQQPRAQILADSLRRVLFKHSSGDQHTSKAHKQPLPDLLLKQASESRWAILRQVKPSGFIDNTNITTPSITTNFVEKLQTSHVDLNNDTTTQVQQKITTGTSKFPADEQEKCASKARTRPSTNILSEQADEFQSAAFRQVKSSHFMGDNNTGRQDELGISDAKHHANQGHHVSSIGKQIPLSSVSLPTKVLGNGAPYTGSGIANAKQPTPSEHEKQGYFDPNKAAQKPLDLTPKQGNNTGDSNTMSRSSLTTLDAKTIPLVDIRKVLSSDSRSGQGNCASSTGKQDPTDSFSKQVSAPEGSRWGIFSQPKSNIVDNQRYPAKATEKPSKDWSGVLQGPNTVASEAQSDAAPRHLHIQNQRKIPTSSIGIGMQDQKQSVKEDVDQPRQKSWGIFSMKVPTKAPDDKGKSEV